MFRLHFLFLVLLGAAAQGEIRLTLESAPSYALGHNPTLIAARLRIEEARGRHQQSGRLSNPELELDFARNTRGREGSAGIALMQRFPITGRLRHEKAASQAELAAAEAEVRNEERKLAGEVSAAVVRLLAFGGQRQLRTQQLGTSHELSEFLRKRVGAGEASVVDALQVDLESRQIELENLQLAAEEAGVLGELRPLLGLTSNTRLVITGELPSPKAVPSRTQVQGRPDVLAAQARAEAARSVVLEQRARRWEDFGVGTSYTRERRVDEPEPIETEQILGLRFVLPLPIWNDNSGRIREAQAAAERATKEVEAMKLVASAEVVAASTAMGAYAKLISELELQVLPKASQIVEQYRITYSAGQTPLTDVLRARTRLLELQRQRLDALRDYQLARIRHRAASAQANASSRTFK